MAYMAVSINRGTPKWMVHNGKNLLKWMMTRGTPMTQETQETTIYGL